VPRTMLFFCHWQTPGGSNAEVDGLLGFLNLDRIYYEANHLNSCVSIHMYNLLWFYSLSSDALTITKND